MIYNYFVEPKNPNLKHCPNSFIEGIEKKYPQERMEIAKIDRINIATTIQTIGKIIATKKTVDTTVFFFFSTQPEYILAIAIFRAINSILHREIEVYHLMHEPRYERGRVSLKTALLVYYSNWMMSKLADRIILSSQQAIEKGRTFIPKDKIVNINLVFASQNRNALTTNLCNLQQSWDRHKTFSLIGIAAKDKNPGGFLSLASVANSEYPDRARFIRAGWDKDVRLNYEKEGIIQFPNYITNTAKNFLLSLTHIVVIPYSFSTQSGVIAESLSYGKILIINDIPSFSKFKGLKFVFSIDFNSKEQIANCLGRIFTMSSDEYAECCLAAIDYFEQNHSISYLSSKLDCLI